MISAFQECGKDNPEIATEYKEVIAIMRSMEPVHQSILWSVYWGGQSMRSLAEEWGIDDLSVIREHKELLRYLYARLSGSSTREAKMPKVRRGLRSVAMELKRKEDIGPFSKLALAATAALLLFRIHMIWLGGASLW